MKRILILLLLNSTVGCAVADQRSPVKAERDRDPPDRWVVPLSPKQVESMSPDEAKAVLLARSFLEQDYKEQGAAAPSILEFRAAATPEGWQVYVQFVGYWIKARNGWQAGPAMGNFCVVSIGKDWRVKHISPGA
jgi:hypothetical protein